MAHSTIWGLDIGNSAIKAVKMLRSGAEARIVDFDIIDIRGGDETSDRVARVQAALGTLCSNHSFGNEAVFLSLPGDQALFKEFQLPPGSESKLDDLIQFEAKQQIPFPLDQVEMGWERYQDPSGVGLGVELIAVRKNIIDEVLKLADSFKLNVQGITVAPLALFNFVKHEYQPQGATLILDAGYKGTDFVVMNARQMYSRTIPIAGREITRVLENKFKVSYDKAEELKKNIGQSKQPDKILTVIEPTLRQLGAEIQRTIGFYKSKSRGQKIAHAYLLGHTFRLPRMAETMASQVREAPFTIVEGVTKIVLDRAVNPGVFANEFPTMAVAIGLGLQGLGLSEFTVNLLPGERKTTLAVKSKRAWAAISAAMILATLWVGFDKASADHHAAVMLKSKLDDSLKEVTADKQKLDQAVNRLPAEQALAQRFARIGRDRGRLTGLFLAIANLKTAEGKPFFGEENRVFLTNLYLSRDPFRGLETGNQRWVVDVDKSNHRKDVVLLQYEEIWKTLYEPVKDVDAWKNLPHELRPDLPLVVVLSGECDREKLDILLGVQGSLVEALRAIGVQGTIGKSAHISVSRSESQPNLAWNGAVADEKHATRGGPRNYNPEAFHVIFAWEDKDDPDLHAKVAVTTTTTDKKPAH